jgi:hypothetical protein
LTSRVLSCYPLTCLFTLSLEVPSSSPDLFPQGASTSTIGQAVCKLVTLKTPTDARISFLFNRSLSLRLRRAPTELRVSHLFHCLCGRFPSQQGGTPPSATQSPQRQQGLIHIYLLCLQMFTDSSAQWAPATLFLSIDSGLFPLQWGCIPPSKKTPSTCESPGSSSRIPAQGQECVWEPR